MLVHLRRQLLCTVFGWLWVAECFLVVPTLWKRFRCASHSKVFLCWSCWWHADSLLRLRKPCSRSWSLTSWLPCSCSAPILAGGTALKLSTWIGWPPCFCLMNGTSSGTLLNSVGEQTRIPSTPVNLTNLRVWLPWFVRYRVVWYYVNLLENQWSRVFPFSLEQMTYGSVVGLGLPGSFFAWSTLQARLFLRWTRFCCLKSVLLLSTTSLFLCD